MQKTLVILISCLYAQMKQHRLVTTIIEHIICTLLHKTDGCKAEVSVVLEFVYSIYSQMCTLQYIMDAGSVYCKEAVYW